MPGPASVDLPVKLGVVAGGAVLVVGLTLLRFCGAPPLPPKPPPPSYTTSPEKVVKKVNAMTEAFLQGVEDDALRAGVPTPTLDELGKTIAYEKSDGRFTLTPGKPAVEVAGLRLSSGTQRVDGEQQLVLVIDNPSPTPRAYFVATEIPGGTSACFGRNQLGYNAMVVGAKGRELRSECTYRTGSDLVVTHVESAALTPFQAYYVSRVAPGAVGVDERVTRGHKPTLPGGIAVCNLVMSQNVRGSLEDGSMEWRDLIDFYARHNCDSYQYVQGFKAFTVDGEYVLPVVGQ
jgi:hypothetical protein